MHGNCALLCSQALRAQSLLGSYLVCICSAFFALNIKKTQAHLRSSLVVIPMQLICMKLHVENV